MCQTVKRHWDEPNGADRPVRKRLEKLCRNMNERVCREAQALEYGRVGGTAVGLLFRPEEPHIAKGELRAGD